MKPEKEGGWHQVIQGLTRYIKDFGIYSDIKEFTEKF